MVGALHGFTVAVTADRRWDEQTQPWSGAAQCVVHGPTIRTLPLGDEERLRLAHRGPDRRPARCRGVHHRLGVRSWLAGAEGLGLGDELLDVPRSAMVLARPRRSALALTAGIDVDWCTPNARTRS
jgi:uroporphyrinogen-III synthase